MSHFQFEEFTFNNQSQTNEPKQEMEFPVVQLFENTIVDVLEDKNKLYRPVELKPIEDYYDFKNTNNFFLSTNLFDMYNGIPSIPRKNRKMSDQSIDSMVQLFEQI